MKKIKNLFRKKQREIIPQHFTLPDDQKQDDADDLDYSEIKSSHNFKEVDWFEDLNNQNNYNNTNQWHIDEETFNLDYIREEKIKQDISTPSIKVTNDQGDDDITLAYCKDDSDNTSNDDEDFDFQQQDEIIPNSIPKLERMDSIREWNASSKPSLNQDTFFCIYVFLEDVFDILRLAKVCQASYASFRDPYLWRNEIKKRTLKSITLYPELNNEIVDERLAKMERIDVIYKYCRLLMENKVDGIRRGDGIRKAQKVSDIANIEKQQQAIRDSEQRLQGLISLVVVSFLLAFDFLRLIMSLVAYLVYIGAGIIIPIIVWIYYSNEIKKGKSTIFKKFGLPFAIFSSAVFIFQFSFVNTLLMVACTLLVGYFTGSVIVERRIRKQVVVLNQKITEIREEIKHLERETNEKIEQINRISRRIPVGYRYKTNQRESAPTTSAWQACMIQ